MRRGGLLIVTVVWLSAAGAGALALTRYKSTPASLVPPAQGEVLPTSSGVQLASDRPTLIVTVHPQCPCTKATFTELEKFLTEQHHKLATLLLFVQPEGEDASFVHGALWDRAGRWPGVLRSIDVDGAESKRLQASTSGTALLFASDGTLLFRGGLTVARGHEGDSPGAERMTALLAGQPALATAPVFGCGLENVGGSAE
ncbi:MAG: RedB protein [Archangium sp.]